MFCNKCGASLGENARFCRSCGAPVAVEAPAPQPADQFVSYQIPPQENAAPPQPDGTVYAGNAPIDNREAVQPQFEQPVIPQPAHEQPYYPPEDEIEKSMVLRLPPQNTAAPSELPPQYTTAASVKGSNVKGRAFLWLLILYILCGLLFVSFLARFLTSKTYIKNAFKEASKEAAKSDAIIDMVEKNSSLDSDDVEEILEDTDFSKLLTKYSVQMTTFVFDGGKNPKIDADDIIDAIEDNEDEIEDVIGKRLSDKDWRKIESKSESFADEFNDKFKDIKRDTGFVFKITSVVGSVYFMIGVIAVMLLILVRLIFLYRKDGSGVYRAFRGYAIVFAIHGILALAVFFGVPAIISGIDGDAAGVAAAVIKPMFKAPMYSGLIFFGVCVASIAAAVALKIGYNKKSRPAGN